MGRLRFLVAIEAQGEWWPLALCGFGPDAGYIARWHHGQVFDLANP